MNNEDQKLGGPGVCKKCGQHVSNRSFHEANCAATPPPGQEQMDDEYHRIFDIIVPVIMEHYHGHTDAACLKLVAAIRSAFPPAQPTQLPWNEQTEDIFGRLCFECRDYARLLEALKLYPEKRKAEHEQAIVIHFMVNLYLKHGDNWRNEGAKILFPSAPAS